MNGFGIPFSTTFDFLLPLSKLCLCRMKTQHRSPVPSRMHKARIRRNILQKLLNRFQYPFPYFRSRIHAITHKVPGENMLHAMFITGFPTGVVLSEEERFYGADGGFNDCGGAF